MLHEKLLREVKKLELILARENGDVYQVGPSILESLRLEIDRVKGLEENAVINCPASWPQPCATGEARLRTASPLSTAHAPCLRRSRSEEAHAS